MKLEIGKKTAKFIKTLDSKQCRQVIHKIFELMSDPNPGDSIKMEGNPKYKRVDIGEYRIIYKVENEFVKIAAVGKRNDDEIYREFIRKVR